MTHDTPSKRNAASDADDLKRTTAHKLAEAQRLTKANAERIVRLQRLLKANKEDGR